MIFSYIENLFLSSLYLFIRGVFFITKILVITSSNDLTVDYIIEKYNCLAEFYRLNVDFINQYKISANNQLGWSIQSDNWEHPLSMGEVGSIYYRKPRFPNLEDYQQEYRNMINNDILALINGIVDSFEGKVLTKPCILRKCENKVFQLLYAYKNNIKIPISYIGNDSLALHVYEDNKAIIKPISIGKVYIDNKCEIYQTNYINDFNIDIKETPIYVQNYIYKSFEARITIINGVVFPVRIDSKNKLDWRKGYEENEYSLIKLPTDILIQVMKMLDDFELKFGAIDYLINENGEWIFLEINPNGQWQWLEKALHLNISKEIVQYLIE